MLSCYKEFFYTQMLAAEGEDVVTVDINCDKANSVLKEIQASWRRAMVIIENLPNNRGLGELVKQTFERFRKMIYERITRGVST